MEPATTQAIVYPSISPSVTSAKGPVMPRWDGVTLALPHSPNSWWRTENLEMCHKCLGREGAEDGDREIGKERHKEGQGRSDR